MHELVVRGGIVVDGTGGPSYEADVAVDAGRITAVGVIDASGRREIDASGRIVTPGFVDIHTHYDGQASWDSVIEPSCWHGVTTVVTGNCGVGFAPVSFAQRDFLISLMEGVEDIPGTVLSEGLSWNWESLPEFLEEVDRRPHVMDIGLQVPHVPLRTYVMGKRGAEHTESPTDDEVATMARLTREALEAGFLGFSSSRQPLHRTRDGAVISSMTASYRELRGIGEALRGSGLGVFEFASGFADVHAELELLERLARECNRPLSVTIVQEDQVPDQWRTVLDHVARAEAKGIVMKAQVAMRPVSMILGLSGSMNPFLGTPTYQAIADRPLEERVARMRDPEVRQRILDEQKAVAMERNLASYAAKSVQRLYRLEDPPDYEQEPERCLAAEAARLGRDPDEYVYEAMLEDDGRALYFCPLANYTHHNADVVREMALSPHTLFGLSDGGAHVGFISDASFPTTNLSFWARDRVRGEKLTLEFAVKGNTSDNAFHIGLRDRGVVAPGYRADLNVIDFDNLNPCRPYIAHDLPAGGARLLQRARGFDFTICAGQVTFEHGEHTGALPGKVLRGARDN